MPNTVNAAKGCEGWRTDVVAVIAGASAFICCPS
jgi:hypothetical protein